ncbi:MAG: cytochrome c3 family protein [Deltaproteobacteria bacterium]|nr:cytochrome c3 family protein [Candidatus Zymogenaceae bacterium]
MKKSAIIPGFVAFILFLMFAGVTAFSTDYGPGLITIDDTTKATNRYLGVNFSHTKHTGEVGLTCVMCHHTEKKDFVSGTPTRCEACHKADAEISFKDAMHRRCVLCHIKKARGEDVVEGEEITKVYNETPPTQCLQCHRQRD